jgi:hypothetical protein
MFTIRGSFLENFNGNDVCETEERIHLMAKINLMKIH